MAAFAKSMEEQKLRHALNMAEIAIARTNEADQQAASNAETRVAVASLQVQAALMAAGVLPATAYRGRDARCSRWSLLGCARACVETCPSCEDRVLPWLAHGSITEQRMYSRPANILPRMTFLAIIVHGRIKLTSRSR